MLAVTQARVSYVRRVSEVVSYGGTVAVSAACVRLVRGVF